MFVYIEIKFLGAFFFEVDRKLTVQPLFAKYYCKGETIIEIPYSRIIYTPIVRLNDQYKKQEQNEKAGSSFFHSIARVTENRR